MANRIFSVPPLPAFPSSGFFPRKISDLTRFHQQMCYMPGAELHSYRHDSFLFSWIQHWFLLPSTNTLFISGGLLPALLQPGGPEWASCPARFLPSRSLSPHWSPPWTRGGQKEAGFADCSRETRNLLLVMSPQITGTQSQPCLRAYESVKPSCHLSHWQSEKFSLIGWKDTTE